MPGDPIFHLIDQILYRFSTYWPKTNKFRMLEVTKSFFSSTVPLKTSTIVAIRLQKRVWDDCFLVWKKLFDYNNLLNGSIQIEFHHNSIFLQVVERLSFFSKSKWTWRQLQLPNLVIQHGSMVYHTAYLWNEHGDPQFLLHFWHGSQLI